MANLATRPQRPRAVSELSAAARRQMQNADWPSGCRIDSLHLTALPAKRRGQPHHSGARGDRPGLPGQVDAPANRVGARVDLDEPSAFSDGPHPSVRRGEKVDVAQRDAGRDRGVVDWGQPQYARRCGKRRGRLRAAGEYQDTARDQDEGDA